MPAREWRMRITDILESITATQAYVVDMDYDSFSRDEKTIDAVTHRFAIIGEAAAHVPDEITTAYPTIPWKKMREMRNVMVHVYFGVNTQILWDTIHQNLPALVPQLQELLKT